MDKYKFGKTSIKRLESCHEDLIKIAQASISLSPIDFGIAEGHRSLERQRELYEEGKSKVDGIIKKGKHNYYPSHAFDVYAWVNNKASWDSKELCLIAGIIISVANLLYREDEISHIIRWGGNWDMDGQIISDQNFIDLPHFELYKPKED